MRNSCVYFLHIIIVHFHVVMQETMSLFLCIPFHLYLNKTSLGLIDVQFASKGDFVAM